MSSGHQRITRRRNIAENSNPLIRVHERYRQTTDRQTTDGRTTTYSEHEHEFTFANNLQYKTKKAQLLLRWPRNQVKPVAVLNTGVDLCSVHSVTGEATWRMERKNITMLRYVVRRSRWSGSACGGKLGEKRA